MLSWPEANKVCVAKLQGSFRVSVGLGFSVRYPRHGVASVSLGIVSGSLLFSVVMTEATG